MIAFSIDVKKLQDFFAALSLQRAKPAEWKKYCKSTSSISQISASVYAITLHYTYLIENLLLGILEEKLKIKVLIFETYLFSFFGKPTIFSSRA